MHQYSSGERRCRDKRLATGHVGRQARPWRDGEAMRTVALALAWMSFVAQACAESLPADFVYLRDVDPTILQDIRYAGSNNFVGRPLKGYAAAECVVRRDVAERLQRIQRDLAAQNLSLKMFDCYRPARAVADMWAWAHDGKETAADRRFSPAFAKKDL